MDQNSIIPLRGTFPIAPKHLNSVGKKAWELGRELWADGSLRARDLLNWELFCQAFEEKDRCEKLLKRDGDYQKVPRSGLYSQHPAVKRRQHTEDVIRRYSKVFGLLPNARKRPSVSQGVAQRQK